MNYNSQYNQQPSSTLQIQRLERKLEEVEKKAKTAFFISAGLLVFQVAGFFLAVVTGMMRAL